jgi:hypothetical protein
MDLCGARPASCAPVPGWWRASLFVSMFAAAAAQLAEGMATALGEREQLRSCEWVDARRLEQLDPQRDIPRWASTRLLDVELPAQQLKSCWASAHLEQQLMEAQARAIASLRGAWMFGVCSHARGVTRHRRTAHHRSRSVTRTCGLRSHPLVDARVTHRPCGSVEIRSARGRVCAICPAGEALPYPPPPPVPTFFDARSTSRSWASLARCRIAFARTAFSRRRVVTEGPGTPEPDQGRTPAFGSARAGQSCPNPPHDSDGPSGRARNLRPTGDGSKLISNPGRALSDYEHCPTLRVTIRTHRPPCAALRVKLLGPAHGGAVRHARDRPNPQSLAARPARDGLF